MERYSYTKDFLVDGLRYRLEVSKNYVLSFHICWGTFPDGTKIRLEDRLDFNTTKYGVNNKTKNPLRVFRRLSNHVFDYIQTHNPPFLLFTSYEKSRSEIYSKLLKRLVKNYSVSFFKESGYFLLTRNIL